MSDEHILCDEDAEEDPHTVMHIYEGDGGVIIRAGGNISSFGVQSRAVVDAFEAARGEPAFEHSVMADMAKRIAELERERDEETGIDYWRTSAIIARRQCQQMEARLAEAEKVIEPFAKIADIEDSLMTAAGESTIVNVNLLRAARDWLEKSATT